MITDIQKNKCGNTGFIATKTHIKAQFNHSILLSGPQLTYASSEENYTHLIGWL